MIHLTGAVGWGLLATAVLTFVMSASQGLGWSRISLTYMLGTMFSARRGRAMAIGSALHFALGLAFAVAYAFAFEGWGRSGIAIGAALGLFHGAFVLVVGMELLPELHPRMATRHHGPTPTRQLEPPGFLALNYGWATPVSTLLAHVAYGALLGAFYRVAA
jgi:uncharacterized membrane protein YagU involved in acid resistance